MPVANNMKDLHTSMLPIGSIIMWGLPLEQKPKNFVLCNGDEHIINGVKQRVPDLLGRFALGVGGKYDFKATGGEYEVQLDEKHMPRHTHGASTSSAGEHKHTHNANGGAFKDAKGILWVDGGSSTASGADNKNNDVEPNILRVFGLDIDNAGKHTHSVTVNHTGGNIAHNNMPPYCSLYYLIKIAN